MYTWEIERILGAKEVHYENRICVTPTVKSSFIWKRYINSRIHKKSIIRRNKFKNEENLDYKFKISCRQTRKILEESWKFDIDLHEYLGAEPLIISEQRKSLAMDIL